MESSILSEVDDTSILRTRSPRRYGRPLNWLPASRLLPRVAGWSAATLCFGASASLLDARRKSADRFESSRSPPAAGAAPLSRLGIVEVRGHARASRLRASWIEARVTKVARVSRGSLNPWQAADCVRTRRRYARLPSGAVGPATTTERIVCLGLSASRCNGIGSGYVVSGDHERANDRSIIPLRWDCLGISVGCVGERRRTSHIR